MLMLTCKICKVQFRKYKDGHVNKNYCSRLCSGKARSLKGNIISICTFCHKEFSHNKNEKNRKYCSKECMKEKYKITEKLCKICNKQVNLSPTGNITYWKIKRFCSRKCSGIYNAAPRKKRNSNDEKWLRWLFRREIEKEVLKRDRFSCTKCGAKNELHVDHIQKWSEYIEGRFDINNCRTVCRKCHYFITFGKEMSPNNQWGIKRSSKEVVYS